MFRHQGAIYGESVNTQNHKWSVGLASLYFGGLPEDGTLVPKHVRVATYHELCFILRLFDRASSSWWCRATHTAPSAPYTRPTQRLSRPPLIQKLGAENLTLQLNI